MSEIIRSFTEKGTQLFASYIESLKFEPTKLPPYELLRDPTLAIPIPGAPKITNSPVASKMELAKKISQSLSDKTLENLSEDEREGMWNWLTLFFFEVLTNSRTEFGEVHRFILSRNWNRRSRHLVESSFNAFKLHGEFASVILENQPWKGGEVFNNLAGTQEYWMNQSLFKTVHSLYWDVPNKRPKKGITPKEKPGTIRRLISVLNQLNRTYDLFALNFQEFSELMPNEFDRWRDNYESN